MARAKIDYGIDLGTTNSAICRMEKGEPVIIKTDVLKDTMPSCVAVNKKGSVKAGEAAYNTLNQDKRRATKTWNREASNAYVEFKRTMGTDTRYACAWLGRDFTSEELSAEVLKTLRSFVTDEAVGSAVITVPAKFTVNQKTATLEAASLAGFRRCELLQEPIAASMAYGLSAEEKDGLWMVFDFGGGTFDAALLRVEDGIMQVFDTEGDNYLGGKNLDYAIVDEVIIPYLEQHYNIASIMADDGKKQVLRDAMKTYAEGAKNQLSFKSSEDIITNVIGELGADDDGEEIELDLTLTQERAFEVMRPYFQKAVDICKELLRRNKLTGAQLTRLILVGGPTHSPLIRQMLREQVTPNVDTSIDPMTAVATGAALYASTLDAEVGDDEIQVGTVKLELGYESTSVETSEWVSAKLAAGTALPRVWVELVRADGAWSSGRTEVDANGNVIEAVLVEGRPNSFTVAVYDEKGNVLPCFPSELTIIQGTKVGAAPLPYNIGIGVWDDDKQRTVFEMARGLEKNKPLPAVGVVNDKFTMSQLRPGVKDDTLRIPVYQTDDFAEAQGKTASLYEYVADVVITGDDIETLIPEGSEVDITLRVDSSEQMRLEAHFLATDQTVEKVLDTSKKQTLESIEQEIKDGMRDAGAAIARLEGDGIPVGELQSDLDRVKAESGNSGERKAVLQHLKEVLRKIESLDESTEWQRLERELRDEFDRLEAAQHKLGDDKTARLVEQLRQQTDKVIRTMDVKMGRETLDEVRSLFVHLTMVYQCMGLIKRCQARFGIIRWKDAARARQLVNKGLELMTAQPTVEQLHPIACALIDLMPDDEAANAGGSGLKRR